MVHSLISLSIGFAWNVAHDAELGGKEKKKEKKKEERRKGPICSVVRAPDS